MTQHYQSAQVVLRSVKEKLASAAISGAGNRPQPSVLDEVVEILSQGRGYSWVGVYLAVEQAGAESSSEVAQTTLSASQVIHSARFPEAKSEIVVPIKVGVRTLGMIDVEIDKADAAGRQERTLLSQVAKALAQYLTTHRGKLLLRKAREESRSSVAESHPHKGPQSARAEQTRAAAGAHSTR